MLNDGRWSVWAYAIGAGFSIPISAREDRTFYYAAFYSESLEALGLEEGEVELVDASDDLFASQRPIPRPEALFEAEIARDPTTWVERDDSPTEMAALRIGDPRRCGRWVYETFPLGIEGQWQDVEPHDDPQLNSPFIARFDERRVIAGIDDGRVVLVDTETLAVETGSVAFRLAPGGDLFLVEHAITSSDSITGITESAHVLRIEPDLSWRLISRPEAGLTWPPRDALIRSDGELFIATSTNVFQLDRARGSWRSLKWNQAIAPGCGTSHEVSLLETSDRHLWIASRDEKIWRWVGERYHELDLDPAGASACHVLLHRDVQMRELLIRSAFNGRTYFYRFDRAENRWIYLADFVASARGMFEHRGRIVIAGGEGRMNEVLFPEENFDALRLCPELVPRGETLSHFVEHNGAVFGVGFSRIVRERPDRWQDRSQEMTKLTVED